MNTLNFAGSCKSLISLGAPALLALMGATANAQVVTGIDASGSYQREVQACMTGKSQQDQATCLKEARNARADKQRGTLDNANGNFNADAASRCEPLNGEDKAACQARVMGQGSTSGSVAGGGVLREIETVVLPAGASSVLIEPKTDNPVVLMPSR